MQPYQEEYIANLKDIAVLTAHKNPAGRSYEVYRKELDKCRELTMEKIARNMELLRDKLFPLLDSIFAAGDAELEDLEEFSRALLDSKRTGQRSVLPNSPCPAHPCKAYPEQGRNNPSSVLAGNRPPQHLQ